MQYQIWLNDIIFSSKFFHLKFKTPNDKRFTTGKQTLKEKIHYIIIKYIFKWIPEIIGKARALFFISSMANLEEQTEWH